MTLIEYENNLTQSHSKYIQTNNNSLKIQSLVLMCCLDNARLIKLSLITYALICSVKIRPGSMEHF